MVIVRNITVETHKSECRRLKATTQLHSKIDIYLSICLSSIISSCNVHIFTYSLIMGKEEYQTNYTV